MKKPQIILIGGGGHCKACIDVIEQENKFQIVGILDLPDKLGENILGYKVIGNDDDIAKYANEGFNFLLTIGHMGNPSLRKKLFELVIENRGILPVVISPNAYVSKYAEIKQGTIIMHNAIVNAGSDIGQNCIINNKALVEHDCIINDQTHISTNAIINGEVKVGKNCFIGSNSVIRNNVSISFNTIIGAGAVVVNDIIEGGVYVGSPAKKLKNA